MVWVLIGIILVIVLCLIFKINLIGLIIEIVLELISNIFD